MVDAGLEHLPPAQLLRCQLWEDHAHVTSSVLGKAQTQARSLPCPDEKPNVKSTPSQDEFRCLKVEFILLTQARQVAARTALIYLKTLTE